MNKYIIPTFLWVVLVTVSVIWQAEILHKLISTQSETLDEVLTLTKNDMKLLNLIKASCYGVTKPIESNQVNLIVK